MSGINFKMQKMIDPKLNLESNIDKRYTFLSGYSETLVVHVDAQTASNNQLLFNTPVPSTATFDRNVYMKARFILKFPQIGGNATPLVADRDALRDNPLNKLIQSCVVNINGTQVNAALDDLICVTSRFYSFNSSKALSIQ